MWSCWNINSPRMNQCNPLWAFCFRMKKKAAQRGVCVYVCVRARAQALDWGVLGGDGQSSGHMWAMGLYCDFGQNHSVLLESYRVMPLVIMEDWTGKVYPQCRSFTMTLLKIAPVQFPGTVEQWCHCIPMMLSNICYITHVKILPSVIRKPLWLQTGIFVSSLEIHLSLRGTWTEFCEKSKPVINLAQIQSGVRKQVGNNVIICQIHISGPYCIFPVSSLLINNSQSWNLPPLLHSCSRPSSASQIGYLKAFLFTKHSHCFFTFWHH